MTQSTSPQYRKAQSGEWVVFGPAASIRPDYLVTVTRRDGTRKDEMIDRVGRTFTVDGVQCVYGYIDRSYRPGRRGPFTPVEADDYGDQGQVL